MGLISVAVRYLMQAGASPDDILAAIVAMEEESERIAHTSAFEVQSPGAKRTAKWRANKKAASQNVTGDVTVTGCDATPSLEAKDPKTQKTQTQPLPKENPPKGGQKKGSPLPDDWQPDESAAAYGAKHGLDAEEVAHCAEEMRQWAGANGNREVARKLDWGRAFKGWLLREAKRRRQTGPPSQSQTYAKIRAKLLAAE
jgi:hypothetical protein